MKHKGRWITALLALLIAVPFLPQVPGCMKALGPKTGRIIDHDSGEGIPGAAVVADGIIAQRGWWQGSHGCTYVVMTYTDKDGYYRLPSAFSSFGFGNPGSEPQQWWRMYASKDGYVPGDTKVPLKWDSAGVMPDGGPRIGSLRESLSVWDSRAHSTSWAWFAVQIPTIELKRLDMTFEQRVALFWYGGFENVNACPSSEPSRSELDSARRTFYKQQMEYVCHAPAEDFTDAHTVGELHLRSGDSDKFEKRLLKVAPPFIEDTGSGYRYHMNDLCEAMKAGDYQ